MTTKSLTITEEAYRHLKAHKRDDESFTDTILRLTRADRDVLAGFGAFEEAEGFRENTEQVRENLNNGIRERQSRMRRETEESG